jgi:hypothetical protein
VFRIKGKPRFFVMVAEAITASKSPAPTKAAIMITVLGFMGNSRCKDAFG